METVTLPVAMNLPNPERQWQSTQSPALPERTQLAQMFEPWPELMGAPWQVLRGGLRNLLLRAGDTVARVGLSDGHNMVREAALHRLVASEIRVPRVLDSSPSVLLLEALPHVELPATWRAGIEVGRTAARIHAHTFAQPGFLDSELRVADPLDSVVDGLWGWIEPTLEGHARARLGALASRFRRLWRSSLPRLAEVCRTAVLVHSDFKVSNVKWHPVEQRPIVFDWEFAWAGPALFDLGQLFRWGTPDGFEQGFVEGYCDAGGTLPGDWRPMSELLDAVNLIDFLGRDGACAKCHHDCHTRLKAILSNED